MMIVGVDEAGRGALVGDVYAAAVILPENYDSEKVVDSKSISEVKRYVFAEYIKSMAIDYTIATATPAEIDALNIHHATLLAMQRAILQLRQPFDEVWVDGKFVPDISQPATAFVKGDSLHDCISAASILAKTARDSALIALDAQHPEYGFAKHKGYATKVHRMALQKYGVLAEHRRSYKTVNELL